MQRLTAQQAQADALRGSNRIEMPKDKYGTPNIMGGFLDIYNQSIADRKEKGLQAKMDTARNQQGNAALAKTMYELSTAADKEKYAREQDAAKVARERQRQLEQDSQVEDFETYVNPDGSGLVTGYRSKKGFFDKDRKTMVDIKDKITYSDYLSGIQAADKAEKANKYGGLTSGQLQAGLKEYRKAIDPLMPVIQGVNNLNSLLKSLPNANEDIPGIGLIEGGSGPGSQFVRALGSQEGRDIHAAWTQTIAPLIRDQAGLAQTQTELKRVEQAYGANWIDDEQTFRTAYPQIMQAIERDLQTIEGTFLPAVGNYYKDTMKAIGAPTVYERAKFENPFASYEKPIPELADDWPNMTDAERKEAYEMFGAPE
jgi:hypothetical protein